MSKEQLEAFETAVRADAGLQEEVEQQGEDVVSIVAIGQREGYTFSSDEVATYLETYQAEGGRELSDEELESVVGAGYTKCTGGCSQLCKGSH